MSTAQHISLPDGRRLTYAEYGDPAGVPLLFCHGIPGSRLLRHPDPTIAADLGVRLIVPDRPGMGGSAYQPGRTLLDWPVDVAALADALGLDRLAVVGYSGGGAFALACAYALPELVAAVGLVSAVGPTDAPGVLDGMLSSNRMGYRVGRRMPWWLWRLVFGLYYGGVRDHPEKLAQMDPAEPSVDHAVFTTEMQSILTETFAEAFRQGTVGPAREGWLLSRPWGFDLADVQTPVYVWQGEDDVVVTPAMGRHMADRLPNCRATFLPGEGHLLFLAHWRNILRDLIP